MSEELIRGLVGAGIGLTVGILLTLLWDLMLKLRDTKITRLEERVDLCEKWVKDLSVQYGEFLEGIKQIYKEAQEQYAKDKAEKEKGDQEMEREEK